MGRKWDKGRSFPARKAGLESEEITIERANRIRQKEEGRKGTIFAKFLNCKQREKVLNKYKELKLWEDQIYFNEDFGECNVEKGKDLFKRIKEIKERSEFIKVIYNRLILYKFWYTSFICHVNNLILRRPTR